MQCPQCQSNNPDGAKFCNTCGSRLGLLCSACGKINPPASLFCNHCGASLDVSAAATTDTVAVASGGDTAKGPEAEMCKWETSGSERKCVTVLFSDLTGYTEMAEKLDPEDVKDITSAIFGRFADIIRKYDGFIEKYIGDAFLAVFGAVASFEDSALRAIRAAREIHAHVALASPRYEPLIGRALRMHSGINTGVVVTGEIDFEKGTHGLVGDTINTAARLMSISPAGEILVDKNSFFQTEGYFAFEPLAPVTVKGKGEPIAVYRVVKALSVPRKLHRLHGLRAELIGRSIEMQILDDAVEKLNQGQCAVVAVCGTAGTGKSRLVSEFKGQLDLKRIQWLDANAYPYTQNTPYYPLIDLLTRAFQIEDGDRPETIQRKVESGLTGALGLDEKLVPYIASLFSIETEETRNVSPEFWKGQLFQAVGQVMEAFTSSAPAIICVEDMHWADPSFLELLRHLITHMPGAAMFVCIYRPLISLFTNLEIQSLDIFIKELRLKELSPSETQTMVGSLLQSETVPRDLKRFVHESVEGNPFYVEEVINSLIDSGVLAEVDEGWAMTRAISEADISTNIQGVLAGRIDRLGNDAKRILQEASVIGRAFLYDILQRISAIGADIDKNLSVLERLDLISARSIQPTLEYIFKHALTQEIVYNGLVKAERQAIHEKIGQVIETLFKDRLSEFYESLAFHYARGKSFLKAVEYLVKSGEKSLKRYSLDEAHQYFQTAFDILDTPEAVDPAAGEKLVDLLNKWAMVFYYRGAFNELKALLDAQETVAERIADKETQGIFITWQGMVYWQQSEYQRACNHLERALRIGEENDLPRVVVHACAWLSWVYGDLGRFKEGIDCGNRGSRVAKAVPADHFFIYKPMAGTVYNYFFQGKAAACIDMGRSLVEYGQQYSQVRCQTLGFVAVGMGRMAAGDFDTAIAAMESADQVSVDTFYSHYSQIFLSFASVLGGQTVVAERLLPSLSAYFAPNGSHLINDVAELLTGIIQIVKGDMKRGMTMITRQLQKQREKEHRGYIPLILYTIGMVYLEMIKGEKPIRPMMVMKNIGFIFQHVPQAEKKALAHYHQTIRVAEETGAMGFIGQAHADIGRIHEIKKRYPLAQEHFEKAARIFEDVGAYAFLAQARAHLEALPAAYRQKETVF